MPFSMRAREDLRDYQEHLVTKIHDTQAKCLPGLLMAIEMGLGKTVTSLTAVTEMMDAGKIRKCLIVAPLRVAQHTWPQEFDGWEHLADRSIAVVCGTKKKREAALDEDADFHAINRENLPWLRDELRRQGRAWPWDCLIYDESSRLKAGKQKTGSGKLSEFGVIVEAARHHKYQILLTGTPTPSGIADLWGQMRALDGGTRLGRNITQFRSCYMVSDFMGYNWNPRPGAEEEVMDQVSDVIVSMSADDHLELPELVIDDVVVDLPPKAMKGYKAFKRTFLENQTDVLAVSAGVLAGKLCQYANGAVYYEEPRDGVDHEVLHDAKIRGLQELVERAGGENLLVAYSYKFDKAAILKAFPDAVAVEDHPDAIERWNKGEIKMMIAHPASIGHGLNLQFGGRHLVWFGMTWSLELYQQFNARLRRSGQEADTVFLHHILARGTIDERIVKALSVRGATQEEVMAMVAEDFDKS